jgi:four helix bundle protein
MRVTGRALLSTDEGVAVAGVARFEDLVAWQRSRSLTSAVYAITVCGPVAADFRYVSQIRSAAVSIMSNVAEGFERESGPQFVQFLQIARASAAEVRSLLYVALDLGYVDAPTFARIHAQSLDVTRLVTALRNGVSRRMNHERSSLPAAREVRAPYDASGELPSDLPAWLTDPATSRPDDVEADRDRRCT